MNCSSSVAFAILLLWQVAGISCQPLEEIFEDFDYAARGFDCDEGGFQDR